MRKLILPLCAVLLCIALSACAAEVKVQQEVPAAIEPAMLEAYEVDDEHEALEAYEEGSAEEYTDAPTTQVTTMQTTTQTTTHMTTAVAVIDRSTVQAIISSYFRADPSDLFSFWMWSIPEPDVLSEARRETQAWLAESFEEDNAPPLRYEILNITQFPAHEIHEVIQEELEIFGHLIAEEGAIAIVRADFGEGENDFEYWLAKIGGRWYFTPRYVEDGFWIEITTGDGCSALYGAPWPYCCFGICFEWESDAPEWENFDNFDDWYDQWEFGWREEDWY